MSWAADSIPSDAPMLLALSLLTECLIFADIDRYVDNSWRMRFQAPGDRIL
jgi:hypothetical protein